MKKSPGFCLFMLLIIFSIFENGKLRAQSIDTVPAIQFPFPNEYISIQDFAEVTIDSTQSEEPPADILSRPFVPARNFFATNKSHYRENIKSVWIRFRL